jgi:hypothetical protein
VTQAVRAKRIGPARMLQAGEVAAKPRPQPKLRLMAPPERITPGSVLFKTGTVLPAALDLKLMQVGNWDLVGGHEAFAVDCKLSEAGWHFSFIKPALKASAIGFDLRNAFAKALRVITRAVEARGFNAVEITAVKRRRWGRVHYVSITAHPRHLRNGPFLRDLDPHHYPKGLWDFKRIFAVRNRRAMEMDTM